MGKKTKYRGLVFRSKLEAKWAVFFDALSIPWKYEPEWFRLPDGRRYLPDFHILAPFDEGLPEPFYVEVKSLSDFSTKINCLPELGHDVLTLIGPPMLRPFSCFRDSVHGYAHMLVGGLFSTRPDVDNSTQRILRRELKPALDAVKAFRFDN